MFIYEGGVFMNKIKVFSLGGLNENGKNLYVVEINGRILLLMQDLNMLMKNVRSRLCYT